MAGKVGAVSTAMLMLLSAALVVPAGKAASPERRQRPSVPCTDAMIQHPTPAIAELAPHARRLGLFPAQPDRQGQRRAVAAGMGAPARRRAPGRAHRWSMTG